MSPPTDLRRTLQRELLRLVVLILVVDAAAIGGYYLLDMEDRGRGIRLGFLIAWVAVTLLVVIPSLQRIKGARAAARRQR